MLLSTHCTSEVERTNIYIFTCLLSILMALLTALFFPHSLNKGLQLQNTFVLVTAVCK
jgi:hypothetical protein